MQLKKIELAGFKSFYKKTTLILTRPQQGKDGITAIVGPNGSGKSNVCDALKWALGGQSKKGFRAKKSRDIIFSGGGGRASLSMAYVSLFFDNSNKSVNLPWEEIVITRKIYASSENEYYVNNKKVRLQNILEILGEAGIGQDSYSIINQGRTDRLIAVGPLERRGVVEEAAKVKHLQIKREKSIKKLDKSLENLVQAKTVMQELEPRLKFLRLQAKKKEEQAALEREYKEKSLNYYGLLWGELSKEKKEFAAGRAVLEKELQDCEKELAELKNEVSAPKPQEKRMEIAKNEQELEKLRKKEEESWHMVTVLEGELEITRQKIKFEESLTTTKVDSSYIKEKLEGLLKAIDRALGDKSPEKGVLGLEQLRGLIEGLKKEIAQGFVKNDNQKKITVLEKEAAAKEKLIEEARNALEKVRKEKDEVRRLITEQKAKEEEERRQYYERENRAERVRFSREKIKERISGIDVETAKLSVKEEDLARDVKEALGMSLEELKPSLNALGQGKVEMQEQLLKLNRKLSVCEAIDEEVVAEYQKTQKRFDHLEKESKDIQETVASLKQAIKTLEKQIEERFEGTLEKINKNFNRYFGIIFKGGQAKLIKVVLEKTPQEEGEEVETVAGIDIAVSLPGKKIRDIHMLSGGERALTSLAFLFSMIAVSNPPFVMLDEVDAALDESNSTRFAKVLRLMAKDTQFVVITHNREVMQEAQVLYGVTMRKDGTSTLLSVALDKKG